MILIITTPDDATANYVLHKLKTRGAEVCRFNPADFPSKASVSISYGTTGALQGTLATAETSIDLHRLESMWYRRPEPPIPHAEVADPAVRDYVQEECGRYLNDIWSALDCLCLPAPPSVIRRAELKAFQLKVAGSLGFELPSTLFSNSPDAFLEFYRHHHGELVSKLVSSTMNGHFAQSVGRYTQVISKRDVCYAQAIRFCPVIVQAYVPKALELRITVVGADVFAAEIHSQAANRTRHDWRRYDLVHTPHRPHTLPLQMRQRCVHLVEKLGLCYGAIDLILTPDGRYVFLEINPNGQYLWIEQLTGLPISDAICEMLMSAAPGQGQRQPQLDSCS